MIRFATVQTLPATPSAISRPTRAAGSVNASTRDNWRFGLCVALSLGLFLGFFFSVS